jgi:excisionase family DNA binding protein
VDTNSRQELVGPINDRRKRRPGHTVEGIAALPGTPTTSRGSVEAYFSEMVRSVVREELAAVTAPARASLPSASTPSEYLTIARAAEVADVHPCTIREWIKVGSLKAYRCGSRGYRILRSELDARLTSQMADPTNEQIRDRVDAILAKRRFKRRAG